MLRTASRSKSLSDDGDPPEWPSQDSWLKDKRPRSHGAVDVSILDGRAATPISKKLNLVLL